MIFKDRKTFYIDDSLYTATIELISAKINYKEIKFSIYAGNGLGNRIYEKIYIGDEFIDYETAIKEFIKQRESN
jgi:hypothetical protein